jgi:hypothetical protein
MALPVVPLLMAGQLLLQLLGSKQQANSQKITDEVNKQKLIEAEEKRTRTNRIRNLMAVGSDRISKMDFEGVAEKESVNLDFDTTSPLQKFENNVLNKLWGK